MKKEVLKKMKGFIRRNIIRHARYKYYCGWEIYGKIIIYQTEQAKTLYSDVSSEQVLTAQPEVLHLHQAGRGYLFTKWSELSFQVSIFREVKINFIPLVQYDRERRATFSNIAAVHWSLRYDNFQDIPHTHGKNQIYRYEYN